MQSELTQNDRPVYSLSDMERMTDKVRSIDGIGMDANHDLAEML